MRPVRLLTLALIACAATGAVVAQFFRDEPRDGYVRLEGGSVVNESTVRTARETLPHSVEMPTWENPHGFEGDVFTFARVIFRSRPDLAQGIGRGRQLGWWVDYPDADLNLSYRLRQMTSVAVDPNARVLKLTDPELSKYPLLFMVHVEGIVLDDDERESLRKHLQAGGTLFVTDFWGQPAWEHFRGVMQEVLPERTWVQLGPDHPLFRSIFPLEGPMHRLRVPTMQFWNQDSDPDDPDSLLQYRDRGEGWERMHVWAMFDDRQRIMAIAFHNTDLSDGWERESENETYFRRYSESRAYPLAINLIFHLMTH